MHKILLYNKFIIRLYMFEHYVLIIRRSKLYYTASGIVTHVGGRPVHRLREDNCVFIPVSPSSRNLADFTFLTLISESV